MFGKLWLAYPLLGGLAVVLPLMGCKKTEQSSAVPQSRADKYLIDSKLIGEYDRSTLVKRVSSFPTANALAQFPIRVYRITYQTPGVNGETVAASGALLLPVTNTALPMLSYQHGTILESNDAGAPSYYQSGGEIWSAVSLVASRGYLVVAPDYIGYGASKDLPHPYEHAPSLASASLDLMRAAREFCAREKVTLNGKNFLLGYSEGGFATMALHKLIEEKHADEFTVTASAPGAGAYHKTAFAKYIMNSDQPLNFISTYVWVLDTYNKVYGVNRPFTYYFNEPWAGQIQRDPFSDVNRYPKQLFTQTFQRGVLEGTDTAMLAAFRHNDVHDWKPRAPVVLFHGTADDYVPFFNSQDAFDAMRARGATQVELRPIRNGNHFTTAPEYVLGAFAFIAGYY